MFSIKLAPDAFVVWVDIKFKVRTNLRCTFEHPTTEYQKIMFQTTIFIRPWLVSPLPALACSLDDARPRQDKVYLAPEKKLCSVWTLHQIYWALGNSSCLKFQGFISCSWGVANVGYVLICYGICDAICSFSFGAIMKVKSVTGSVKATNTHS